MKKPVVEFFKDMKLLETAWLWLNKIPAGMLSLIVGDQDTGKSTLTLFIAAQVSKGGVWPGPRGKKADKGVVVILTTEDDVNRTVKPRLEAAGADMSNVVTITGIVEHDEHGNTVSERLGLYNLTEDKDMLLSALFQLKKMGKDVKLIILDPISAFLGGKNANNNSEVREFLAYLTKIAETTHATIIGINHLNKDSQKQAVYRTLGSVGWTATSRAVWLVAKDPNDEDRRIMSQIKCNLTQDKTGLAFRLVDTEVQGPGFVVHSPRCDFEDGVVFETADELLDVDTQRANKKKQKKQKAASTWLKDTLANGPVDSKVVWALAGQNDIGKRALEQAKSELKIKSIPLMEKGRIVKWGWVLPQ